MNNRKFVLLATTIAFVMLTLISGTTLVLIQRQRSSQADVCTQADIEEVNDRLDALSEENKPDIIRQSDCYTYQDFEPSDIELVFLLPGECVLEEEPTVRHVILYVCTDDDYLKRVVEEALDYFQKAEQKGYNTGELSWWVYIPR